MSAGEARIVEEFGDDYSEWLPDAPKASVSITRRAEEKSSGLHGK